MERLRTLAILMCLGAGSQFAFGEPPAASSPPAQTESEAPVQAVADVATQAGRPEPPAAPRAYLKAAAELFNRQRYELAERYLAAAEMYRDRLTSQEQVVLDVYRHRFDQYVQGKEAEKTSALATKVVDQGVVVASTVPPPALDMSGKTPLATNPETSGGSKPAPGSPAQSTSNPASDPVPERASAQALRGTSDIKQQARWLLHKARDQIHKKQFDTAEKSVAEARAMNVKWGYFDDSPEKVMESMAKAKSKEGLATGPVANQPHDRRTAKARLREARLALAAGDLDKADAIAREVREWNLRYVVLEETPDKVSVAVAEGRRRAAMRNAETMVRSYVGPDASTRGEPTAPAAPNPAPAGLR